MLIGIDVAFFRFLEFTVILYIKRLEKNGFTD